MRRRLLCLDMDGTLLNDDGALGPETVQVLARLRSQGHIVSFVTGRGEIDMLCCRHLYGHADYLLLNNGGKLVEAGGRVLFNEKIPLEPGLRLVRHCLAQGLQLYAMMGLRYAVTRITPGVERYAQGIGVQPALFRRPEELPLEAVESFMSGGDGPAVNQFIQAEGLPLRCVPSEPGCCDIMPEAVGKWAGARRLAAQLGIPQGDVLAAGNYDNDVDMLQGAGIGVAVANALDGVKAAADYVTTRSNNQDALAEIAAVFFS